MTMTQIEEFSDSYFVIDAELMPYSGDSVSVAQDTHDKMRSYTELPLLKIHSNHYLATPEWGIPQDVIAVPKAVEPADETALMAKQKTAVEIVERGNWVEEVAGGPPDE